MATKPARQDYLKVDPEIPGQKWVVLSFVSPEDMVVKRHLFYINHFLHVEINKTLKSQAVHNAKKINAMFEQRYNKVLNKLSQSINETDKLVYYRLKEIKDDIRIDENEFATECLHSYTLDYDEIHDRFQIYQTQNLAEMDQKFAQENQEKTSVRGLKVRGVYNQKEEAEERAKFVNQNIEPAIHAYVAPVGYWCPWDPNPDSIKDSQYQNEELNKLMGQYHENVQARNKFFEDRKRELSCQDSRDVLKERLRAKIKERQDARRKK